MVAAIRSTHFLAIFHGLKMNVREIEYINLYKSPLVKQVIPSFQTLNSQKYSV
jgi:hypothetical protein